MMQVGDNQIKRPLSANMAKEVFNMTATATASTTLSGVINKMAWRLSAVVARYSPSAVHFLGGLHNVHGHTLYCTVVYCRKREKSFQPRIWNVPFITLWKLPRVSIGSNLRAFLFLSDTLFSIYISSQGGGSRGGMEGWREMGGGKGKGGSAVRTNKKSRCCISRVLQSS